MRRRENGGEEENEVCVVLYEFYFKNGVSKCVISARLVLLWNCKRILFIREVLRIFFNCSREFLWEIVVSYVNYMTLRF